MSFKKSSRTTRIAMKLLVILIVSSLLALAQGGSLGSRIVNGVPVKLGERPFQVSLQTFSHFCGGSIISENYVVTAAHCLEGQRARDVEVIVGTVSLKGAILKHPAEKLTIHEKYDPVRIKNDIALIKVSKPFEFSEFVKPVPLPKPHYKVKTNSSAIVSGWGNLLSSGGNTPDQLRQATIFIADPEYCKKIMEENYVEVFPTNICANDPKMRRGQCNGDSGGPLTVDGVLTGIVSWSIKDPYCASTKYPGVYTRVCEFIDWLEENMK